MSSDRKTRASFVTLNRPEPPDPEFAARLRAQVLGEIPVEVRPARVVPFQRAVAAPSPRRRTRWLDIAAAAVLLIGIVSGLASLAPASDSPATIYAPVVGESPVLGSATGETTTALDRVSQESAEITILVDADGLLAGNEAAEAAAISAIRDALVPFAECRAAIALTFGWHPNVETGAQIAARINALLPEAAPELFAEVTTENFATIGPSGKADIRLYMFQGCPALGHDPGLAEQTVTAIETQLPIGTETALEPTAAVEATANPLAAQDGQRSGRFPPADASFELLWELPPVDDGFGSSSALGWWPPRFSDDAIYWTMRTQPGTELQAVELTSGDVRWRTPVVGTFPIMVTPAGVVAALPVEDAEFGSSQPFSLALLDRQTGAVRWQTAPQYRHNSALGFSVVSGESVIFLDESLTVVAIDVADGSEHWRYDTTRGRSEEEMLGECAPLSQPCSQRRNHLPILALWGDTVYAYLPVPAEVAALSAADGSSRWTVSLPERTGQLAGDSRLLATELGVVVTATDTDTSGVIDGDFYVGLWAKEDGVERWRTEQVTGPVVRAGSSLFARGPSSSDENALPCCVLLELDLATGAVLGTREGASFPSVYFPDGDVLLLYATSGETSMIRNLLAADSSPVEALPIPGCDELLPTGDGRHVLCPRTGFTLAVYRVSGVTATPVNSFEISSTVVVTANSLNLRGDPSIDPDNVVDSLVAGDVLEIISGPTTDEDGTVWYRVRDSRTALTGYVAAEFIRPAE